MAALTIRIFKSWLTVDERNSWSNVYEIDSGTLMPNSAGINAVIEALVNAERDIHLASVQFFKVIVSTWGPDGGYYDPNTFRTFPLNVQGLRTQTGDAMDSNITYYVRRTSELGRYGRLYYRGCLTEGDVVVGGDLGATLSPTSSLRGPGEAFLSYRTKMAPLFEGNTLGGRLAMMSMVGPQGGQKVFMNRQVTNLVVGGVVVNRRNHRWFDRAAT